MFEGSKTSPLLLYDLLVLCPSKFTVIMTLPGNIAPFLVIKLIDSTTTHSFFVTFDQKSRLSNSNRNDTPTSSASLATDAIDAATEPTATASSLSLFCILLIIASCFLILRIILTPLWYGILHGEVCYLPDETRAFQCHNSSEHPPNSPSLPLLDIQTLSKCSLLPKHKQSKSPKDSPASPLTSSQSSGSSTSPKLLHQNVNRPPKPKSDSSHFPRGLCSEHESFFQSAFQKLLEEKQSFTITRTKIKDIVKIYFVVLVIYFLLTTFTASFFIFQTLAATRSSPASPSGSKVNARNGSSRVAPKDAWRDLLRMESLLSDCNSKFLNFVQKLLIRSESHFAGNPTSGRNFETSDFFRSGKIGSINQPTSAVVENSACRILPSLCLVRGRLDGLKDELMEETLETLRKISMHGTSSAIHESRWLDIFKHLSNNVVEHLERDKNYDDDGRKQLAGEELLLKFSEFKVSYDIQRLGDFKASSFLRLFVSKQQAEEDFDIFMEYSGKRL